jgi:hypothetical protein
MKSKIPKNLYWETILQRMLLPKCLLQLLQELGLTKNFDYECSKFLEELFHKKLLWKRKLAKRYILQYLLEEEKNFLSEYIFSKTQIKLFFG